MDRNLCLYCDMLNKKMVDRNLYYNFSEIIGEYYMHDMSIDIKCITILNIVSDVADFNNS